MRDGKGHPAGGNSYDLGGNSFAIVAGDFNGDGVPDLAAGVNNIYPNNHVAIFIGDGSGAFTSAPNVYVPDVTGLAAADFNGERKLDLAIATYGFSAVDVAVSDGNGRLDTPRELLWRIPAATYSMSRPAVSTATARQTW